MRRSQQARAHGCEASGERLGIFCGYGGLRAHWDDMMEALAGQQPRADGNVGAWLPAHPPVLDAQAPLQQRARAAGGGRLRARRWRDLRWRHGRSPGARRGHSGARRREHRCGAWCSPTTRCSSPRRWWTWPRVGPRRLADLANLAAPYDVHARGFVPGEAAAALVLQRPGAASALARITAADGADGRTSEAGPETLAAVLSRLARADAVVDGAGRAVPALDAGRAGSPGASAGRRRSAHRGAGCLWTARGGHRARSGHRAGELSPARRAAPYRRAEGSRGGTARPTPGSRAYPGALGPGALHWSPRAGGRHPHRTGNSMSATRPWRW